MNDHPLTEAERCQISALLEAKLNQKEIAALLKRSPAMISRELKRNSCLLITFQDSKDLASK